MYLEYYASHQTNYRCHKHHLCTREDGFRAASANRRRGSREIRCLNGRIQLQDTSHRHRRRSFWSVVYNDPKIGISGPSRLSQGHRGQHCREQNHYRLTPDWRGRRRGKPCLPRETTSCHEPGVSSLDGRHGGCAVMLVYGKNAGLVHRRCGATSTRGAPRQPRRGWGLEVGAAVAFVLGGAGASYGVADGVVVGVGVVPDVCEAPLCAGAHVPEPFIFSDRYAGCDGPTGEEDGEGN